jgi:type I restriction enzyme R subunit
MSAPRANTSDVLQLRNEQPMLDGLFRRRRLPHWDVEDGTYFVTSCLEGSLPASGLAELFRYRDQLDNTRRPENLTEREWEVRKHSLLFARFGRLIDETPAVRHLENSDAAGVVRGSLYHFAGERYDLLAYVVMPSHFHWLFHPRRDWCELIRDPQDHRSPRERIMHSVKGYSGYRCNRILGLTGTFWQGESYDHVVRNEDEMMRIIEYIEMNPVKAGLAVHAVDWRWSSAFDRKRYSVPFGEPLPKCP